ncbi:MAG: SPOR domain-containing protein [Candidatus Binatia bacterium]
MNASRKVLAFAVLIWLLLPTTARAESFFSDDELTARAAYLMDAATGKVLYQREAETPLPPASTTKIVTALVVLDSHRLKETVQVGKSIGRIPSTKLGLRPGQSISMEDLLYGLLLASANDAGIVLARAIGGSVERFAKMMTAKAAQLGARNTQFVNPPGLTAPGHYSTARDLAVIFNQAMKHPEFKKIVQTKTSRVDLTTTLKNRKRTRVLPIRNHNRLLWDFDGAIGGKTGYTLAAQKCFVGGASRNGATLIVSILGSRNLWGDARKLLEYGFNHYEQLKNGVVPGPLPEKPSPSLLTPEEERQVQSRNGYIIQVGSFRERELAHSLNERMVEVGYPSYMEVVVHDGGETNYRVRLGPFANLHAAQDIAREIEGKSGFRPIILSTAPDPTKL